MKNYRLYAIVYNPEGPHFRIEQGPPLEAENILFAEKEMDEMDFDSGNFTISGKDRIDGVFIVREYTKWE